MRQLNKVETLLLLLGGLLMVTGSGASIFLQSWAPYVFAPGALLFAAMQMRQRYEGRNITIRRLRRIMLISDVLFLLAAIEVVCGQVCVGCTDDVCQPGKLLRYGFPALY